MVSYLTIFRRKEEGSGAESKKSLSEKTEADKLGGRGVLVVLLKVEKIFMPPLMPLKFLHCRFFTILAQAFLQVTRAAARSRLSIVQLVTGSSRERIMIRWLLEVK